MKPNKNHTIWVLIMEPNNNHITNHKNEIITSKLSKHGSSYDNQHIGMDIRGTTY